jgi:MoaA/NifB/PqqE/SkfB family radical SAM enzyme
MYALDEIRADPAAFRQAVDQREPYIPLYVKIKLSFGCNLKCVMCNHWRETRPPPLPFQRLQEIVTELAALGCRKIHFSGGEPLLRPDVPELVAQAASLGIRTTLTTNGTLVDKELAKRLVQAGLRGVNVSIDSPARKVHDKVRGVEGAWKKAVRAVGYFRKYAHKGKITIRINTVVSQQNYSSLLEMADFTSQIRADQLNLIPVDDHCGKHLTLKRQDLWIYNSSIAPQIARRGLELGVLEQPRQAFPFGGTKAQWTKARHGEYAFGWYQSHPCFAPWTHTLIDFNGLVYICCMTREQIPPLGDLKIQSLKEVWEGGAYHQVRRKMQPPALNVCRQCDDFLLQNRELERIYAGREAAGLSSGPKTSLPLPVHPID